MDDDDPLAAFELAARHGYANREPLKNLARAEPVAALDWMASHQIDKYERSDALNVLVTEHPEEVSQYLSELPTGELRSALIKAQLTQLASQDPALALALIAEQPGKHSSESSLLSAYRKNK